MSTRLSALAWLAAMSAAIAAAPASAQTRPMHSGHLSHGAPQMKKHGSGVHHPNRPSYHHHVGHPGYRAVYPDAPHSLQASEQGLIF